MDFRDLRHCVVLILLFMSKMNSGYSEQGRLYYKGLFQFDCPQMVEHLTLYCIFKAGKWPQCPDNKSLYDVTMKNQIPGDSGMLCEN